MRSKYIVNIPCLLHSLQFLVVIQGGEQQINSNNQIYGLLFYQ